MKTVSASLIACILLLALLLQPLHALAQPLVLTPEQIEALGSTCSTVQVKLQKLQRSDAVSRINHGRDYDQLLNQVAAFNSRLVYNKISLLQFGQIASDMQATVEQFRSAYNTYYASLEAAINSRCRDDPAEFYNQTVKAREQRVVVHATIGVLEAMIAKYRDEVQQYRATLAENIPAGAGR